MTRRITLAILVTVWTTLIVVGIGAYLTIRSVLVSELDESLKARAMALPQVTDGDGNRYRPVTSLLPDDRVIAKNGLNQTVPLSAGESELPAKPEKVRAAFVVLSDGTRARTITLRAFAIPDDASQSGAAPLPVSIVFTASAEDTHRQLDRLALVLIVSGVLGGVLAALIARQVAKRALRPLHATAQQVAQIDDANLHRRIDQQGMPEELLPMATKLNEMLTRLDDSQRQRQQFLSNASHELRTPVAALMTAIEVTLRRERDAGDYQQTLRTCLIDAKLLQRLVEVLMAQARSGATPQPRVRESVDVRALAHECAAALAPLADQRAIQFVESETVGSVELETEPDRLRSIFLNLIGNAIEYNEQAGSVTISCKDHRGGVSITIRDTGPGIPEVHVSHVFEPFYRVDGSRSSGHLGLGLHLVRAHVQALSGTCDVRSVVGEGTEFEIWIPQPQQTSGQATPRDGLERFRQPLAVAK